MRINSNKLHNFSAGFSARLHPCPSGLSKSTFINKVTLICEFLPSANEVCEGYVFTRVFHSFHGGGSASVHAGIPHFRSRHPPGAPPRAVHAGRYGQQAGGTHPTGMYSFLLNLFSHFRCIRQSMLLVIFVAPGMTQKRILPSNY